MRILIVFLVLFSCSILAIEPKQMIVIVSDEQKSQLIGASDVKNYLNGIDSNFNIFSLDDVGRFEKNMSKGLSSNKEEAREQVKSLYEDMGKEQMSNLIIEAYKAKMYTLKYNLQKYPAIIFDDKYVVYGEFNLNRALNEYLQVKAPL